MITIEFLVTSLVVILIPGTGVIYTVATGLFIGMRSSFSAAVGCTLGIIPSLIASIFGLAAIIHTSAIAFQVVKYAGVVYILYLAWLMWRSSSPLTLEHSQSNSTLISIAIKGFLINILNPKLSIFFLAFLPQFVSPKVQDPFFSMLALGFAFMLMTLGIFIIYGLMASYLKEYLVRYEKVSLAFQRGFAGLFAILGLKLAFSDRV